MEIETLVVFWLFSWLVVFLPKESYSKVRFLHCCAKLPVEVLFVQQNTSKLKLQKKYAYPFIPLLLSHFCFGNKKKFKIFDMKMIISYKMLNQLSGGAINDECRYFRDEHTK